MADEWVTQFTASLKAHEQPDAARGFANTCARPSQSSGHHPFLAGRRYPTDGTTLTPHSSRGCSPRECSSSRRGKPCRLEFRNPGIHLRRSRNGHTAGYSRLRAINHSRSAFITPRARKYLTTQSKFRQQTDQTPFRPGVSPDGCPKASVAHAVNFIISPISL